MRTKAQQEADRKYRAKHPPTEEQRKQARARWIRWYEKNQTKPQDKSPGID
jgi:hypothetical protein